MLLVYNHFEVNRNFGNIQGEIPLQGDFSAEHMIFGGWDFFFIFIFLAIFSDYVLVSNSFLPLMVVEGSDPVRRERLIELLDIDLQWRMHKVSDGQRRRVQICMGLLHPFKV